MVEPADAGDASCVAVQEALEAMCIAYDENNCTTANTPWWPSGKRRPLLGARRYPGVPVAARRTNDVSARAERAGELVHAQVVPSAGGAEERRRLRAEPRGRQRLPTDER